MPAGRDPRILRQVDASVLGIAFPTGGLAITPDAAYAVAAQVGYRVAMKAQAAAHGDKSEAGASS